MLSHILIEVEKLVYLCFLLELVIIAIMVCDIGASSSSIPYELYKEIMHEIGPCELDDIDVVIHLANK